MPRQGWPANSKDIYNYNAALFSSKFGTFALQIAHACVAELFSKLGGTSARQKNYKVFGIWIATVTSQALTFDVINFCQHVQASSFKIWLALNDPYLHNTLSIIHYTDLST